MPVSGPNSSEHPSSAREYTTICSSEADTLSMEAPVLKRYFNAKVDAKVLAAVGLVATAVVALEPGLFALVLPVLLLAVGPLSILLTGRSGASHEAESGSCASSMHADGESEPVGPCPRCAMSLVSGAAQRPGPGGSEANVEELQLRLQVVTEHREALLRELEEIRRDHPEAGRTILEEAESIARAAAE